jgi:hypothetical protein
MNRKYNRAIFKIAPCILQILISCVSGMKTAYGELRVTTRNSNKDVVAVIQLRIAVKTASQM